MKQKFKIHFLGAAGTVTGSKFLLETNQKNILVDCGMFQGTDTKFLNLQTFAFPPEKIDLVLLTHGHLDHSGYLPRLVKEGFDGPVYATAPSLAIASIIVLDSAKIMEENAEKANAEEDLDEPEEPFYTVQEAEETVKKFKAVEPDHWNIISEGVRYRFIRNGHIIGASFIEMELFGKRIVFSGDIGREKDDLLDAPEKPAEADILFLESTYGNRLHPQEDPEKILLKAVKECIQKKGNLIIPSFAVERIQLLMFKLWKLYKNKKLPEIPAIIDSPMGNQVLEVFSRFPSWHNLPLEELQAMKKHFHILSSYKETWKTIENPNPKIIIAGSGMVSGGRVLTYLRYFIERPETIVMLAGFQAEGTRGRMLQEGASEIMIFGKSCAVKAKIIDLQSLSAHADQQELLNWISRLKKAPEKIFLIHGEPGASAALKQKILEVYGWEAELPVLNEIENLET